MIYSQQTRVEIALVAVHAAADWCRLHFVVAVPDVGIVDAQHVPWPVPVGFHDPFHEADTAEGGVVTAEAVVLEGVDLRCSAVLPAEELVVGRYPVGEQEGHGEALSAPFLTPVRIPLVDLHETVRGDVLFHEGHGSFILLIYRFAEAAGHFLSSADIVKAAEGDYSPEAGEDLESAAFCYEKMGMYPLALELYEQSLNISLMNLGNASIHPKPIMCEISSIYYKMGDTGSARERMDRYDSFPE